MTFTAHRSKHTGVVHVQISISLPQMPFDVPPAVSDETAPKTQIIKGALTPELRRWIRGAGRAAGVVIKPDDLK